MKSILLATPAVLVPLSLIAGAPLWTITPTTPTTLAVSPAEVRTVQYRITNRSRKTQRLEMKPIPDIAQLTEGAGRCGRVFTLQHGQSCLLVLEVDGGKVAGQVAGGPAICAEAQPAQCYQPQRADLLDITPRR